MLLALVLSSHIKLHFKYFRILDDDTLSLEFFIWGFINYKIEVPVIIFQKKLSGFSLTTRTELETGGDYSEEIMSRKDKKSIHSFEEAVELFNQWWPFVKSIHEDVNYFLRHLIVERFAWHINFGTSDAAATGILSGIAWSIMGGATAMFYEKVAPMCKPELKVEPNFKKAGFSTSFDCIFKIRVGNIMVTGIKILKKKVMRRGVNDFGRTSHRRSNENGYGKY